MVVNEAMAAGLPVIVSNACGCTNDLVIHNKTGWIFDFDDADSLCKLLHLSDSQESGKRQSMAASAKSMLQNLMFKALHRPLIILVSMRLVSRSHHSGV